MNTLTEENKRLQTELDDLRAFITDLQKKNLEICEDPRTDRHLFMEIRPCVRIIPAAPPIEERKVLITALGDFIYHGDEVWVCLPDAMPPTISICGDTGPSSVVYKYRHGVLVDMVSKH